jgi:DNA-binding NarL/FixJ family response regulator
MTEPSVSGKRLSARELQVLDMASLGLTNAQVADELHVSIHAVKFHLAAVYRKLSVANRTEAASAYLRSTLAQSSGDAKAPAGIQEG